MLRSTTQAPASTPVYELTTATTGSDSAIPTQIHLKLCMLVRDEALRESYLAAYR